ncbi:MAG TPA: pyruvate kinase [Fimbriimonadaceae bacterium]|nr:pyruvate kinase [Fimbriimonadaceae bacterium]HRJ96705.1 pyruvate kinase [Fimbriimonadaceae bacterium]
MKRRTKIVCTLGPAVGSRRRIGDLVAAGMNVARINCSHGDWETRRRWIEWVRECSPGIGPVAVLADLQGPKFRIGDLSPEGLTIVPGQALTVGQEVADIVVHADTIFDAMQPGSRLLLGDGDVELKLGAKTGSRFAAKAISGGHVKSRQGVTLVGRSFESPCLTEKDVADVFEACRAGVEFIALSYVRKASDLRELRRLIDRYDPQVRICAKIETKEAVRDIDEIVQVSDLVMVARGDLGLQMDIEEVPLVQKKVIARCARVGKPVITATQMLESMMRSPRPTRAETTDVANAILDGTDAIMLSGETAAGEYPIEAVKMMARIAHKAEGLFDFDHRIDHASERNAALECTEAVALAATRLANSLRVKALLTTTASGHTTRMVSKFRPRAPILCVAWEDHTFRQLAVVWGVETIRLDAPGTTDEIVANALDALLRHRRLKIGDTVVVTAGIPPGTPGHTNLVLVETVR